MDGLEFHAELGVEADDLNGALVDAVGEFGEDDTFGVGFAVAGFACDEEVEAVEGDPADGVLSVQRPRRRRGK